MRRVILGAVLVMALLVPATAMARTLTYGFDDGTFEGWALITPDGSEFPDDSGVSWLSTDATIDIGDGFTLLAATSGDFRVAPEPWEARDCLGGLECFTQVLRSPSFFLDGSGDLTIDMIGGGARSDGPFDPDVDFAPEELEDLPDLKEGSGLQGFALVDVATGSYVAHGFPSYENDGKARASDPVTRKDWETVAIPQDELSDFANNGREYAIDIFDSYSGGWGWIGFDTVKIPGATDEMLPGDFNLNGVLDQPDIDDLTGQSASGANDLTYDLNDDSVVDTGDVNVWVKDLFNSWIGDANLDGEFDSSDLVVVLASGTYETGAEAVWSTGDFNGDGLANTSDLVGALADGGYENGPRAAVATVPEPASATLLLLGGLLLMRRRRT